LVAVAGIGTRPTEVESVTAALEATRHALEAGATCLDAAVVGVAALEDDPALNAGTGAALRLDGSAELDAAVMSSNGKFGAVGGLTSVRHPAEVARAVADTPHHVLAGVGAVRFARALGIESFDVRTEASLHRYKTLLAELQTHLTIVPRPDVVAWADTGAGGAAPVWQRYLPHPAPAPRVTPPSSAGAPDAAASSTGSAIPVPTPSLSAAPFLEAPATAAPRPTAPALPTLPTATAPSVTPFPSSPATVGGDTVAVLVRCPGGEFAGAASSGGPWLSLPGRLGDVPVLGAALYVGPAGAVFVTGSGERILERLLARAVYEKLREGSVKDALETALAAAPPGELAVTILDGHGVSVAPETASAWAIRDPELHTSKDASP